MCFSLAGVISANKGIAGKLYDGLGERDCGVLTEPAEGQGIGGSAKSGDVP